VSGAPVWQSAFLTGIPASDLVKVGFLISQETRRAIHVKLHYTKKGRRWVQDPTSRPT
jgi:hypothetical protein